MSENEMNEIAIDKEVTPEMMEVGIKIPASIKLKVAARVAFSVILRTMGSGLLLVATACKLGAKLAQFGVTIWNYSIRRFNEAGHYFRAAGANQLVMAGAIYLGAAMEGSADMVQTIMAKDASSIPEPDEVC